MLMTIEMLMTMRMTTAVPLKTSQSQLQYQQNNFQNAKWALTYTGTCTCDHAVQSGMCRASISGTAELAMEQQRSCLCHPLDRLAGVLDSLHSQRCFCLNEYPCICMKRSLSVCVSCPTAHPGVSTGHHQRYSSN